MDTYTCTATHPLGFACTLNQGHTGPHRCVYDYAYRCVECGHNLAKGAACPSCTGATNGFALPGPNHPADQVRGHQ